MKRVTSSVPLGTTQKRYKVRMESDECTVGTIESRLIQFDLLERVASQPDLSACGGVDFQTMKMSHNGHAWICEFEAIVNEPQTQ